MRPIREGICTELTPARLFSTSHLVVPSTRCNTAAVTYSRGFLKLIVDETRCSWVVPLDRIRVGGAIAATRTPLIAGIAIRADLASIPVEAVKLDSTARESLRIVS